MRLSPSRPRVAASGHLQFSVIVQPPQNPAVEWQVNGVPGGDARLGTISASGLYLAPPSPVSVLVKAVLKANPRVSATARVGVLAPHRIGVRPGATGFAEFFDRTTGDAFTPRGNNYVRLAWATDFQGNAAYAQTALDVGFYDAARAEAALASMEAYGYNAVRVLLNDCCTTSIGNPAGGLSSRYVANLVDFLRRARSHGVYAILTAQMPPWLGGYTDHYPVCYGLFAYDNLFNLCSGGVAANVAFFHDVARALVDQEAPLDAVLAYELRGEYFYNFDQAPLSWTSGLVTTANGLTYDMASASSRQAMMDDGLVYFTDQGRAAILDVDPTALVGVGFFWPQDPNPSRIGDPRVIEVYPAMTNSTADFVDIHGYAIAGEISVQQMLENYKLAGHQEAKPVLMGEFGAFKFQYPSITDAAAIIEDWQVETCASELKGWLLWTWDTEEPEQVPALWSAMSGDGSINRALAPAFRPDPCR
ncbi:MAG TPA: cellulase family glycosylhydrolase [Vicinamibacteria bacterium]|nr:cellulase family glycosylhydrolase [Vicinamibacteria bacterium]